MRILLILAFIMIYSTPFAQADYYYLNYRFIDPKEYDKSKAAPLPVLILKGREAQKALKDIMTFGNDGAILTINSEEAEETYLQRYYPESGLVEVVAGEFDDMYDVKNKKWLEGSIDPASTKTSPDGKKQIICTPEFDGIVMRYYNSIKNIIINFTDPKTVEYYWDSNNSIKYLRTTPTNDKEPFLPAVASILPIEMIKMDAVAVKLIEEKYDKSKVKTYIKENDNATALVGLMTYDNKNFIKTLKTRSGKELVIIPELVFVGYYPELDIIRFAYDNNIYTYNLTTGEAYDTIGDPETWAVSPAGEHRLNYIENLHWLEKKGADGLFTKIALLNINERMKGWYWADNNTIHFQHVTTQTQGNKSIYTPKSAVLIH